MRFVLTQKNRLLIGCSMVLAFAFSAMAQEVLPPTKKVLIFEREPYGSTVQIAEKAIKDRIQNFPQYRIQSYRESLDALRIPGEQYESELVNLLRRKYENEVPDLIFVLGSEPLRFLLRNEATLFPGVPKVYILSEERLLDGLDLGQTTTGVVGRVQFVPTVELMLAQNPGTRKIWIVTGTTEQNIGFRNQAKAALASLAGRVEFVYPEPENVEQLRETLSGLPRDNLVLYIAFAADKTGRSFAGREVSEMLAASSSVPIYGVTDNVLGTGIVGGEVLSFKALAVTAADMGMRVLDGEPMKNVPPYVGRNVPMFDGRQLRRWNIDESLLPIGSEVQFREPTDWEQYQGWIIGIIAFTFSQSLLIGWLLFIRHRRKAAELEVLRLAAVAREEHKKLDEVITSVPGIVWESRIELGTSDRRIDFVSDAIEQMLGYSSDEAAAIPNFWRTVVLEEDHQKLDLALDEMFAGRGSSTQQFRCRRKDGKLLWLDTHMAAISDGAGTATGVRGVAIDITDRKLAEEELQERELDLAKAQRLSHTGSWEWDPATDSVLWSQELFRIAGMDPSQPVPNWEKHSRLYTPESFARLAEAVKAAMDKGLDYELELEMIRTDGRKIWTLALGEAVRDAEQKIVKLRGTLQDISARKETEAALSQSEERYRNVVETQTQMICRYLPDTTLTFVNDAYCRYFKKTREELIGTKFIEFVPTNSRDQVLSYIESLVVNPRTETYEHEVIRPNGERGWHRWTDSFVETQTGEYQQELQAIGLDITDVRQAEEELSLSESRFQIMADSTPLLIWICGPDKLCTYVNKAWLDFTGRPIEMELGTGWTVGIHSEDSKRVSEVFNLAFDRKMPFTLEYRLRGADGDFHWVYDSGTPRFSSEGDFLGFIGSCVDISDRKEAEYRLKTALAKVEELHGQLREENIYLREVIELEHKFDEIVGQSDSLKYVLFKIQQVAKTDATVLITGETGTGKELVARAIHSTSQRKSRPLVKLNCAALSASLIESELFGHEKGAFTGASALKTGRFELADKATIFLDEVGELPLELQAKLLRVIQEGEFERLGSSKTIKVDARILAATNRDLAAEVKRGTFREDLLFRLNVFPITVPPLRDRKEDIPTLVEYFADRFSKRIGKTIRSVSPATMRRLTEHSWPGNVRELANVIERSVINSQSEVLSLFEDFDADKPTNPAESSMDTLEAIERNHIVNMLVTCGWKIEGTNGAARVLGLNPSTLRTRMSKLGISRRESGTNDLPR